jgi:hypothetical protein
MLRISVQRSGHRSLGLPFKPPLPCRRSAQRASRGNGPGSASGSNNGSNASSSTEQRGGTAGSGACEASLGIARHEAEAGAVASNRAPPAGPALPAAPPGTAPAAAAATAELIPPPGRRPFWLGDSLDREILGIALPML